MVRAQQCTCSWLWVQGWELEAGGFRPTLKFPGLRKGRDGPLGPIRGSLGFYEQQKREQMLVGQIQQMSTRVMSSIHALCTMGAVSAYSKDTASAWRFQILTLFCSDHGALMLPSSSLHTIRSWRWQWELWKYHRTLPLSWLFTGEINRETQLNRCLHQQNSPRRLMQESSS